MKFTRDLFQKFDSTSYLNLVPCAFPYLFTVCLHSDGLGKNLEKIYKVN